MKQHKIKGLTLEMIAEAFREILQTLEDNARARASGEVPPDAPLPVAIPAFLVPPPYEVAAAELENQFRAAISRWCELNVLLNEVFATSFRVQFAAALTPEPLVAGKDLDDRLEKCIGELNPLLDRTGDEMDRIHTTRGLHDELWGKMDSTLLRFLGEAFARQGPRHRPSSPDPGHPSTPDREGGAR